MTGEGLRRGTWSPFELRRLGPLFAAGGVEHAASQLRRSPETTRRKLEELLRRKVTRGRWSDAEILQLRSAWGALDVEELTLLMARSERDIRQQAESLRATGSGPWGPHEHVMLKKLFGTRTPDDLEVCLSRPAHEIQREARALRLGLDRRRGLGDGRMPRWRPDEVDLLVRFYPELDSLELAQRLGRTVQSVANKASQLGLRKQDAVRSDVGRRNVGRRYGK